MAATPRDRHPKGDTRAVSPLSSVSAFIGAPGALPMSTASATAPARRIMIFRIGSLGDTLVALPAFRRIRAEEPQSRIVLLTNAPVDGGVKAASSFQVLLGSGLVDDFIEYHPAKDVRGLLSLFGKLRQLRPQRTIYLMPIRTFRQRLRDIVFLRIAGIRRAEGLELRGRIDEPVMVDKEDRYESEAARLFRSVGGSPSELSLLDFGLGLTAAEQAAARARLPNTHDCTTLAVSIGTKFPANDWGQTNWHALLKIIAQKMPGCRVAFFGSADEAERCAELGRAFGGRIDNLCGKLTPRESGAALALCDLFIGHDSGPMHLASASGIPLIGIFSARFLPGIWYPFGVNAHVFYNSVQCRGCGLEVCTTEGMRCIRGITVEAVADKALSLLQSSRNRSSAFLSNSATMLAW